MIDHNLKLDGDGPISIPKEYPPEQPLPEEHLANPHREGDISRYSRLALHISRSDQAPNKPLLLKVVSGSMSPLLQTGDTIYMEFTPPESLKRGDIVVFHQGESLVTHRLISISPRGCLTKGDALLRGDAPVGWTDIIGRVVAFQHKGKITRLSGWRWRMLNHMFGLFGYWEAQVVLWGDKLIRRDQGVRLPAWIHFVVRSVARILRAPARLLGKLFLRL